MRERADRRKSRWGLLGGATRNPPHHPWPDHGAYRRLTCLVAFSPRALEPTHRHSPRLRPPGRPDLDDSV